MNTELNFPRRLLAGLTALALLLMLALPVWAEGEETEKLPVSINSVEDLLQLVTDCRLDSWSEDRTVDLNTDLDLTLPVSPPSAAPLTATATPSAA